MKSEELLRAFDEVDEKYFKLVESEATGSGRRKGRGIAWRIGSIAACLICMVGLLVVFGNVDKTLASKLVGLRSLLLKQDVEDMASVEGPQGVVDESALGSTEESEGTSVPYVEPHYAQGSMITLSGYLDSPEANAASEWQNFLDGYDQDQAILNVADKTWVSPKGYEEYFVYSWDMVHKLEEIITKYGLGLHVNFKVLTPGEIAERVGGTFWDKRCDWGCAYIYDDGTFQFDAYYLATDARKYGYQFRRTMKGYFDEVILNVGFVNDYDEWRYVTKDGAEVMLALSDYKGLVYGDFDRCFIAVNVLAGTSDGVTKEDLEMIADSHHLSMLK